MLRFDPWIPNRYNDNSSDSKLLLLGESHYGSEEQNNEQDFTQKTINDVIKGKRFSFYTKLGRIFYPDDHKRIYFKAAFGNLIQNIIIEGSGAEPTKEDYETITPAFWEILRTVKPDKLIVFSTRIWENWLPDEDSRGKKVHDLKVNDKYSAVWKYEFEDVSCFAIGVNHPRTNNFYEWKDLIKVFLETNYK